MKRLATILALSLFLTLAVAGAAISGVTERVSVSSAGAQGNAMSGRDGGPAISLNGRFVAFPSDASNLVAGDTNGCRDVFVHDRLSRITERVSVSSTGEQGNAISDVPSISADGRYVAFHSLASNLVPGGADTNGTWDIFVRDRLTGTTERASVTSSGAQANDNSSWAQISADGTCVAFWSFATNLAPEADTNGTWDIFVRDRTVQTTERVSLSSMGAEANNACEGAAISGDGRFVAWCSRATNLVSLDTFGYKQIFLHDRVTHETQCVSVNNGGMAGNSDSFQLSISANGQVVAFCSQATNFVEGDTNWQSDDYVRDLNTGTTERVSISTSGEQPNDYSGATRVSADGRYVVFDSRGSTLVPGDTNGSTDVFVRDRLAGTTERTSLSTAGEQGNADSFWPFISGDGRFVSFVSSASSLLPPSEDINVADDAFVRDRRPWEEWGALEGRAFEDANGNGQYDEGVDSPIVGADLQLSDGQSATSEVGGVYQFTFVSAGGYSLAVSAPGYAPRTIPVTIEDGQLTNLDIQLAQPFLSSGYVMPTSGDRSTRFTYRVKYWNMTNVLPSTVWLGIWPGAVGPSPSWRQMWEYDPSDTNAADGKWYTYFATLPGGNYAYRFAAAAGAAWAHWPKPAGTYNLGPAVAAGNPVVISSSYVTPTSGSHATSFTWRVKYWNANNAAPDDVWLAIWFPTLKTAYWYPMWPYDTGDANYRDGAWYTFSRRWLPPGGYAYRFAARQGSNWAYWPTPAGSYRSGPTVGP